MAIRVLTGQGSTGYRVPRFQEWLQTSPAPGANWQQATVPVTTAWSRVRYLGGPTGSQFVAVGGTSSHVLMTSPDGLSWTQRSGGFSGTNPLADVAFNNNATYVATELATSTTIWTSPDAITWTARTCPSGSWTSVIWFAAANLFVAVDNSLGTGTSSAITSPDGITWTARTMPSSGKSWSALATDGTYLVAVAGGDRAGGTANATTSAAYSTNGTSWSAITMPSSLAWTGVAVSGAGGTWLAVATNGGIAAKCVGAPSGTWATAGFSIAASDVIWDATTSTFGIAPASGTSGLSATSAMVTTTRTLANSTSWNCLAAGPRWSVVLSRSGVAFSNASPIESPTWTCPAGVTSVDVTAVGAGGGGGAGPTVASGSSGSGGAGGGGQALRKTVTVVPGTTYAITIGNGGTGGALGASGGSGGVASTSFGALVTAFGGGPGAALNSGGGSGGNGGGGAGGYTTSNTCGGGGGGGAGGPGRLGTQMAFTVIQGSGLSLGGDPQSTSAGQGGGNWGGPGMASQETRMTGGYGGNGVILNGMAFAGGGGGGYYGVGSCGGGAGSDGTTAPAAAAANSGSGGGGGSGTSTGGVGGNGGSGYARLDWLQ